MRITIMVVTILLMYILAQVNVVSKIFDKHDIDLCQKTSPLSLML